MNFWKQAKTIAVGAAVGLALAGTGVRAEVTEVRISKGHGILYLPLIVMEDQKLLEKQAAKAGLGALKVNWLMLDGGNVINDAMMAGSLDFAGIGAPVSLPCGPKPRASPMSKSWALAGSAPPRCG